MSTQLTPHVRGDTFVYIFNIDTDWTGDTFTGGLRFTVRKEPPASISANDKNAVASVTEADGISWVDSVITVEISADKTKKWPAQVLYWDLQGIVNASPAKVYTIGYGTINIIADISRTQ